MNKPDVMSQLESLKLNTYMVKADNFEFLKLSYRSIGDNDFILRL